MLSLWTIYGLILFVFFCDFVKCDTTNLTCYQCVQKTNIECGEETLLPCPAVSDRCVTHIAKDAQNGFTLKRECGLGPCGFDDDAMNKGLGLDECDRSRDEYFCIFCCRGNGCNKSFGSSLHGHQHTNVVILFSIFMVSINSLTFWKLVTC